MVSDGKPDTWIVLEYSDRPICIIEVKSPIPGALDHPQVCGQVFDHMVKIRASYGQCEIFGIITTLSEWRVVWFEDTNALAQATICNADLGEADNLIDL